MSKIGVSYKKKHHKNAKISEKEVTKASIAEMDIESLMNHVE
jgi:tRNA 2-selenouridine synthase SelU